MNETWHASKIDLGTLLGQQFLVLLKTKTKPTTTTTTTVLRGQL